MPSKSYMNGSSSVYAPFAVLYSDYDGGNMLDEIKTEMDKISDEPDCKGRPVPFYIMRGSVELVKTEVVFLYMFGGVPLILDPGIVASGTDVSDAVVSNETGSFITDMYMQNNDFVFSIGYVDDPCEAYGYAVDYTKKHVPSKDSGIDAGLVNSYIAANPDSMDFVGTVQRMGGTRFDVYAISATESAMFRSDKDFIGGEPDVEDDTEGQRGRYEVILVGGNPDIVPIGVITGLDGWMFTVWVPNEAGFVECGLRMLAQGDIPHDVMYVDEVELEQAFDMYSQKLQEDARVADEKDAPPEKDDVPDFDYDEYYASERGERPVQDIPELP